MSDPLLPPRPEPPRRPGDVLSRWVAWIGLGRILLGAVGVIVVVGGMLWLVRTEAPPVEATLPMATSSSVVATGAVPPIDGPVDSAAVAAGSVIVHVAGAVSSPGVYELDAGARVDDAVRAAGGPTPDALLDGLNLAAVAADGQRIYVPVIGEVDPATIVPDTVVASPVGPIDLNAATVEQLDALPGVGPATAAAIVDDRERNGPFASVDDLERVPGIGPAKLAALRDLVTV